jgi:hypothetical protein
LRQHVEGHLLGENLRIDILPIEQQRRLAGQLFHGLATATRHRLIGCHIDTTNPDTAVDRCDRNQHLNR